MTIEFENDRVRVTRVKAPERSADVWGLAKRLDDDVRFVSRLDRLVVYLRDGHVVRSEDGSHEALRRGVGEVVWRDASTHAVMAPHANEHEVLIIELKDSRP